MKKNIFNIGLLFAIALTFSCGNANKDKKSGGVNVDLEDAINQAEKRRSADPEAEGGNKCLLAFAEKYDQLLTEEMAIELTGFSKDKLDVKYSKGLKNTEYHSISYRFMNNRIGKVMDYDTPVPDNLGLKYIKPMSLTKFKSAYRILSTQEQADADKVLDDVATGKSDSEEANKKIEDLEKQGIDKKTTKGVTDVMKGAFAKINQSYFTVNDLGDSASWNSFTKELHVLKDGVHFEIYSSISGDDEVNKKTAIATAKKILEKCK